MGVTLDLRIIDHERIVVRGLQVVQDAIRHQDPERLRCYLAEFPIDVDPDIVAFRETRLSKLRELKAPPIIIQNEEKFLRLANGEAYWAEELQKASFDELRQLLGTWCWITHSFSLDKAWDELHWFLEPAAGPNDAPLSPPCARVGDPEQTIFGKALQGAVSYPKDDLGDPIIRTLGSPEPDCSGYNPPGVCQAILQALDKVNPDAWSEHVPFRLELYRRAGWGMDDETIAGLVEDELTNARDVFGVLRSAYSKAVDKGFGLSCEYSL